MERDQLTRWARRASSAQALALRAKIVLACAEGLPNRQVAADLRVAGPPLVDAQQLVHQWLHAVSFAALMAVSRNSMSPRTFRSTTAPWPWTVSPS